MSLALQKKVFHLRASIVYESITYDYLETKRTFLFGEVNVRLYALQLQDSYGINSLLVISATLCL